MSKIKPILILLALVAFAVITFCCDVGGGKTLELRITSTLAAVGFGIWLPVHYYNLMRFGASMTIEEALAEESPKRVVQLLRYHHFWSDIQIANELNGRNRTNNGVTWTAEMVRAYTGSINKFM